MGQLGTLFVVHPAVVAADWSTSPIAGRVKQILKNGEIFKNHKITKKSAQILFNFLRHGVWLPDEWKCSAGDWFVWDNHSLSGLSMARFQFSC